MVAPTTTKNLPKPIQSLEKPMEYKILLPTAGTGSRLKEKTTSENKALLKINDKAIISYILDSFDPAIPIVLPLGFMAQNVKNYLLTNHPDRQFEFVIIDPFEGPGSGLGLTVLKCKKYLQCPFIFCSNDTLVLDKAPEPNHNWMGYARRQDTHQYRCLAINENNAVSKLCEKGDPSVNTPYIGLCGVLDYKNFWTEMEKDQQTAIETGESHGLRALINTGTVKAIEFPNWQDTGNPQSLADTVKKLK